MSILARPITHRRQYISDVSEKQTKISLHDEEDYQVDRICYSSSIDVTCHKIKEKMNETSHWNSAHTIIE